MHQYLITKGGADGFRVDVLWLTMRDERPSDKTAGPEGNAMIKTLAGASGMSEEQWFELSENERFLLLSFSSWFRAAGLILFTSHNSTEARLIAEDAREYLATFTPEQLGAAIVVQLKEWGYPTEA